MRRPCATPSPTRRWHAGGIARPRPLRRHPARLHAQPTSSACPARFRDPPHAGRDGRPPPVAAAADRAVRARRSARSPATRRCSRSRPGCKAIYLSGWQVAADANTAGQMYPDQSLYPVDSVPNVVRRINNALRRADQIAQARKGDHDHLLDGADHRRRRGRLRRPAERLRADEGDDRGRRRRRAFRGPARLREEVRPSRRQGAGADRAAHPHPERRAPGRRRRGRADRAAVPHRRRIRRSCSPPTSTSATARSSPASAPPEGFFRIKPGCGVDYAIARSLAYAPYADLLWWETCEPDLDEARALRRRDPRGEFPGKMLAYNCSPASTGAKKLAPERHRRRSSARSARWATSSSSSRWPASTA